jgi:hypothetical protein
MRHEKSRNEPKNVSIADKLIQRISGGGKEP